MARRLSSLLAALAAVASLARHVRLPQSLNLDSEGHLLPSESAGRNDVANASAISSPIAAIGASRKERNGRKPPRFSWRQLSRLSRRSSPTAALAPAARAAEGNGTEEAAARERPPRKAPEVDLARLREPGADYEASVALRRLLGQVSPSMWILLGTLTALILFFTKAQSTRRLLASVILMGPMFVSYQCLKRRVVGMSPEEEERCRNAFHESWAQKPLSVCLRLGGFYIKLGQVLSSIPDVLPAPYQQSLRRLQENVPHRPVHEVCNIIEDELDERMRNIFRWFAKQPVGSASIGQVHFAELLDGTPVAVKVQYPEVEHFFRLDFSLVSWFVGYINPDVVPMLEEIQKNFMSEFDYQGEAANLRRIRHALEGKYEDVVVPEPYDVLHLRTKTMLGKRKGLVARRVLVMERCQGQSLTRVGRQMMERLAESKGQSIADFEREAQKMRKTMGLPEMEKMIARLPTARQLAFIRSSIKLCNKTKKTSASCMAGISKALNCPIKEYAPLYVPPNGPQLTKRLFDIHAYALFECGLCNPDPHPGNILYDESTEVLSLIDYGQLCEFDSDFRANFARFIIAMAEGREDGVVASWIAIGNQVKHCKSDVMNDPAFTYAFARLEFGGFAGYKGWLQFTACENLLESVEQTRLILTETAQYAMAKRSVSCLRGACFVLGDWSASPATLLAPAATAYLRRRGLPTMQ
eukprot:TRINITY_DN73948_c0_g1_i1.p1 TRINITY_DN73948_c0_g1~~TRINITY_DN73948_c0_g1_i1.p1  ORF type:complete len:753 (-),score=157.61 TRINITY_DN73948_c0_g1_i1:296-2389(-)